LKCTKPKLLSTGWFGWPGDWLVDHRDTCIKLEYSERSTCISDVHCNRLPRICKSSLTQQQPKNNQTKGCKQKGF